MAKSNEVIYLVSVIRCDDGTTLAEAAFSSFLSADKFEQKMYDAFSIFEGSISIESKEVKYYNI